MPGFGESPFRSRFFDRPSRFPEAHQPPEFCNNHDNHPGPSASETSSSAEDPFKDRDSIPIKVIHEYTSAKPPSSSGGQHAPASKQQSTPAQSSSNKFQPPKKSASTHEVPIQPPRKPQVYQKSSSAGIPVSVLREEARTDASPTSSSVSPAIKQSLDKIVNVEDALGELSPLIDAFTGAKSSKDYVYLDEMLTRNLIKLDDVETHGDDDVRSKRKACVHKIQKMVEHLDLRSKEHDPGPGEKNYPLNSVEKTVANEGDERPDSDQKQQETSEKTEERIYDPSDEGTSV
jgi:hypothetical protein